MKTIHELQQQFLSNTYYKGIPTCKNPMDLWIYQEIIHEVKPDVIIEIGVWHGGVMRYILNQPFDGEIIGIDLDITRAEESCDALFSLCDNVHLIQGDATEKKTLDKAKSIYSKYEKVLVIEDSSHTYENTLECLKLYSPLVSVGSYYIVEDTIAPQLGYDLHPDLAVADFLRDNDRFEVDKSREKYITWNPGGFLKRVK